MCMRACAIFDTRYGNAEKIACSFEAGLREIGVQTVCANTNDVNVDPLREYDMICVGAPTEWLSASRRMKEFLERLKQSDLLGKFGFAFDTKLDRPLAGSAAKLIEKELRHQGLNIIATHESTTVFATSSSMSSMRLKDGEEERCEHSGRQIGAASLKTVAKANLA
jgi:flavodoxin